MKPTLIYSQLKKIFLCESHKINCYEEEGKRFAIYLEQYFFSLSEIYKALK